MGKVPGSFNERSMILKLHYLLYTQCYKRLPQNSYHLTALEKSYFDLMRRKRNEFNQRIKNIQIREIHADIQSKMDDDVDVLIERITITKERIFECLEECVPQLYLFGDIIIDYLSKEYPFLIEPRENK